MSLSVNDVLHLNGLHDAYKAADVDASEPGYYGFLRSDGLWYILKQTTTLTETAYRYAKGASGYAAAWTGRAALSYGYFADVFPTA